MWLATQDRKIVFHTLRWSTLQTADHRISYASYQYKMCIHTETGRAAITVIWRYTSQSIAGKGWG